MATCLPGSVPVCRYRPTFAEVRKVQGILDSPFVYTVLPSERHRTFRGMALCFIEPTDAIRAMCWLRPLVIPFSARWFSRTRYQWR